MRNASSTCRAKAARQPFFGLGLDLEPVLVHAATMCLRPFVAVESSNTWAPKTASAAGYELQVRLGRETRAG